VRRDRARRRQIWGANALLVLSGSICLLVAIIGLFVRASPGLSGLFLLVSGALLVVAVYERRSEEPQEPIAERPELEPDAIDRSARAAEAEVARGRVTRAEDVVPQ
jgi:hypothetical protein